MLWRDALHDHGRGSHGVSQSELRIFEKVGAFVYRECESACSDWKTSRLRQPMRLARPETPVYHESLFALQWHQWSTRHIEARSVAFQELEVLVR